MCPKLEIVNPESQKLKIVDETSLTRESTSKELVYKIISGEYWMPTFSHKKNPYISKLCWKYKTKMVFLCVCGSFLISTRISLFISIFQDKPIKLTPETILLSSGPWYY